MPPVRITSVMPTAMIPFSEAKRTMLSRLREVRKTFSPLRTGARIADTMRMATSPKTLWKRSRKRPAALGPAGRRPALHVDGAAWPSGRGAAERS